VTGPLITGRDEPFRRDGWLAVICIGPGGERGKGYRPRFALATPFGLVGQDAVCRENWPGITPHAPSVPSRGRMSTLGRRDEHAQGQPQVLPNRYTMQARIAGCPCRTVLRRAVAGVGLVSKRARRRRRGDPRLPS
jgi:hypothetical protein